ncbi:MAG: 4Fe-4S dicluster domain-containing protein, partial [Desulfobacterales bacterium]
MQDPISIDIKNRRIATSPELADACFTCGTCASGCPATNLVPGWDPRKAIRAIALGLEQEVIDSKWPWVCTLCGRCQYACPMGVQLIKTFRTCRIMRERDEVPDPLHRGTMMNFER